MPSKIQTRIWFPDRVQDRTQNRKVAGGKWMMPCHIMACQIAVWYGWLGMPYGIPLSARHVAVTLTVALAVVVAVTMALALPVVAVLTEKAQLASIRAGTRVRVLHCGTK